MGFLFVSFGDCSRVSFVSFRDFFSGSFWFIWGFLCGGGREKGCASHKNGQGGVVVGKRDSPTTTT